MRLRIISLAIILLSAALAAGQSTAVTLQVTDSDGIQWANGTWQVQLIAGTSGSSGPYNIIPNGPVVPNQLQSGGLTSTGAATMTLTPNASIAPAGTIWYFAVCPNATTDCYRQSAIIVGASQTVTLVPPGIRINGANAPPNARAYNDLEIVSPTIGTQYFNVSTTAQRIWLGTIWTNLGGGASSPALTLTNSSNCTTVNSFVELDTAHLDATGNATAQTASLNSKKVIGVASSGAGCSGTVSIATSLSTQVIADGQTQVGDWVAASPTAVGEANDYGAAKSTSVQTVGIVSKANTGAGTLTTIIIGTGDQLSNGSSNSNGSVANSGCANAVPYYATTGNAVSPDCNFTTNGSGTVGLTNLNVNGAGTGVVTFLNGAAPTVPASGKASTYVLSTGLNDIVCTTSTGANCGAIQKPSTFPGATADVQIKNACAALPASGGTVDLRSYGATTQTIAAPITGCMSPTKIVTFLVDTATKFSITESDGGTVFPLDNSSSVVGHGLGQCQNSGAFALASTANITAIFGPAHTDGSQEDFTVKGICAQGKSGATVSKGLIYVGGIGGTNTSIADNFLYACNTSCIWMENSGGSMSIHGNEMNGSSGDTTITSSPLVLYVSGGSGQFGGVKLSNIFIFNNNIEHANGANQSNIKLFTDGSLAWFQQIIIENDYIEREPTGTADTVGIQLNDCWDCVVRNVEGGGITGGTDFIKVSATNVGQVRNVQFYNISSTSYTNLIHDNVQGSSLATSLYPNLVQYSILPGYWQSAPNAGLVANGPDVLNGAGLFSGTGTAFAGWSSYLVGLTAPEVTFALNNTDAPNSPTISGGTSSQDITVGANSLAAYAGTAGIQTGTIYSMIAGRQYTISAQARIVSGSYNTFEVFVGSGGVNNCVDPGPAFFPTSSWATYSFPCVAIASENVLINAAFLSSSASATGEVAVGNIQIIPVLSGNPGNVAIWNSANSVASVPGALYSAAGTALPTCNSGINGQQSIVSDATSPTYGGVYTSGGTNTADVICSYNGTSYSWKMVGLVTSGATSSLDLTAQAASIGATTLYAVPTTGTYQISYTIIVTQAATTSSTLPSLQFNFFTGDSNTSIGQSVFSGSTSNTLNTYSSGVISVYAKAGTNIQYQTNGYASSGATPMQYALHVRVQAQ